MRGPRRLALAGAVLAGLALAGCYTTTIRSGRPALPSSETVYWHHAFLFGLVEASGPYELNVICPDGWAELHADMTAFHAILRIVTVGLYAPAKVHVVCAALPGVDVNSVSEGPVPMLHLGAHEREDSPAAAPDAGALPAP